MKSLKKNQIIILVIALMLVSAGYLNYTANNQNTNTLETSIELNTIDYAGIGDAKLVNSNGIVESNSIQKTENNVENVNNIENYINEQTNQTNAKMTDEYFSSSRLTRDTMYSQMIETYEKILEN